jgi:hypothetical protein
MKVTDFNEVKAEVAQNLAEHGSTILDYLTLEEAVTCITLIYLTNDLVSGFGQDFVNNPTIISSPHRIAIIYQEHHSFYKSDLQICGYEDLTEDIDSIRTVLDAALARWEAQN